MLQLFIAKSISGKINPYQIGSFRLYHLRFREILFHELAHIFYIFINILHQFIYPLSTFGVTYLDCKLSHQTSLAVSCLCIRPLVFLPQLFIWNDDICRLKSCYIECLSRGAVKRKDLTVLFVQIHAACEGMSRENEITVHFIHHPGHVVFQANLCNSFQFFSCPDSSDRIVRITEDQRFYAFFPNHFFHLFKVDGIMIILIAKLAVHQSSSVILDDFAERIVYRLHHHHGISLFGKCSYAGSKCIDNPGTKCYPLRFDRISITCGEPVVHCCKIFIQRIRITKDSMVNSLVEFIQNLIRKTEIHVCYPERKQVISSLPFHSEIIFQAVRSMSVDYFIKIVFSHLMPSSFSQNSLVFYTSFC